MALSIAPDGPLAEQIDLLADAFVLSSKFQDVTDNDGANQIYVVERGSTLTPDKGRCLLGLRDGYRFARNSTTGWVLKGTSDRKGAPLASIIDIPIADEHLDSLNDSLQVFRNQWSTIVKEICQLTITNPTDVPDIRDAYPDRMDDALLDTHLESIWTEQTEDEGPIKFWRVMIVWEIAGVPF